MRDINLLCIKQKRFHICGLVPQQVAEVKNDTHFKNLSKSSDRYYFVQIKDDTHIQKGDIDETYPAGTIFFLKKESTTAHYFLAKYLLGLETRQLKAAGELLFENEKLIDWNLQSGSYWRELGLDIDKPAAAKLTGLPQQLCKWVKKPEQSAHSAPVSPAVSTWQQHSVWEHTRQRTEYGTQEINALLADQAVPTDAEAETGYCPNWCPKCNIL